MRSTMTTYHWCDNVGVILYIHLITQCVKWSVGTNQQGLNMKF